jgi:S1-C subfamily serine protease
VPLPEALAAQAGQTTGLLVMSVEPGSPAEQGGMLLGDTLLSLEGSSLQSMEDLFGALSGERVGKSVEIRLLRGGQLKSVKVTIGERG